VTAAAIKFTVLMYGIIIGVHFDPWVREKHVEAFGAAPFGVPVVAMVLAVLAVLALPIPWFIWHAFRLSFQAHQDQKWFGPRYLFRVGGLHPHLRRSRTICLAGLAYFLILSGTWIAYATARGI
jgi:hypothetical protein